MNGLVKICATETVSQDWSLIWSTVLVGISVVFAILAILIAAFYLMGAIFKGIDKSKKKKAEKAKPAPAPVQVSEPVTEAEVYEDDDDEIIAVISAAIAAYGEADGKQYRIASITKRDSRQRSSWSSAGIAENTRGF